MSNEQKIRSRQAEADTRAQLVQQELQRAQPGAEASADVSLAALRAATATRQATLASLAPTTAAAGSSGHFTAVSDESDEDEEAVQVHVPTDLSPALEKAMRAARAMEASATGTERRLDTEADIPEALLTSRPLPAGHEAAAVGGPGGVAGASRSLLDPAVSSQSAATATVTEQLERSKRSRVPSGSEEVARKEPRGTRDRVATVLHTNTLRNMPAESKERIFSILLEELGLPREAEQAVRSSIQAAIQATAHPTALQAAPTKTRVPQGHATVPAAVQPSVGTGMHQALTEPSSPTDRDEHGAGPGLSFVPGTTSSMHVRMPHASVFNRVMANIWVPLAQFSFEGIAKGLEKGLRSETNKSLMAKLGLEPEMPQITAAEADMSVGEMRMNLENWCVVLDAAAQRWAAQGEQQKEYQLHGDARVWREATQFLFALPLSRNPQSWPAMAAYIARMRENFYASAVGARPCTDLPTTPCIYLSQTSDLLSAAKVPPSSALQPTIPKNGSVFYIPKLSQTGTGTGHKGHAPATCKIKFVGSDLSPVSSLEDTGASLSTIDSGLLHRLGGSIQGPALRINGVGTEHSLGFTTLSFGLDTEDEKG
ncbi:hypothetical protein V8E36_001772 [Tilletia maclaganii]